MSLTGIDLYGVFYGAGAVTGFGGKKKSPTFFYSVPVILR